MASVFRQRRMHEGDGKAQVLALESYGLCHTCCETAA